MSRTSDPLVRTATADDLEAVVALERDCLGVDAWPETLLREGLTVGLPTMSYVVAVSDGVIVGWAAASLAGDLAELQRIAVDPGHRRRGLAGVLLDSVVATASSGGADRLLLEVRADNAGAIAFYTERGFTEIDRRRRYYRDGATAVVMLLPLDQPLA